MPIDPLRVIGEILGEPAAEMRNPVNADYRCPFMESICDKRGHQIEGPLPVCSIWAGGRRQGREHEAKLMAVCPKRFYQADFFNDVIDHCWPGSRPDNPRLSGEITMKGLGRVDFVIADIDKATDEVKEFVSIEMQAVDISGSYMPAYTAVLNSQNEVDVSYGVNWKNVQKRYISQLVQKGFYHHIWNSRIVAVLQKPLYAKIREDLQFDEMPANGTKSPITFMLYDFVPDPDREAGYFLEFDSVVSTSHSSLMNAALYQDVPSKSDFTNIVKANLSE